MSFPDTRHTLIQRLVQGGGEADWREFLDDYWGPVCRFARARSGLSADDSEDVASQVLQAIVKNRLLGRWSATRSAKLRTLICAVVRNVLSNRVRVEAGRARLVRDHGGQLDRYVEPAPEPGDDGDAFYAAWARDVVQSAVESLMRDYHRAGKGDYFRVLYGRLCDGMSMPEIAESLDLDLSTVENYFRHARKRLGERLEEIVRGHVVRYSTDDEAESEAALEWQRLGDYLQAHGGLEDAVRRSYAEFDPSHRRRWTTKITVPVASS